MRMATRPLPPSSLLCTSLRRLVCLPNSPLPPRLTRSRIRCTRLLLQRQPLLRGPRAYTKQHHPRRHVVSLSTDSALTLHSIPKPPPELQQESHHQRGCERAHEVGSHTTPAALLSARSTTPTLHAHRHHLPRADRGPHQRRRGQGKLQGPQEQARLNAPRRHHRLCPHLARQLPQQPRRHVCPHPQGRFSSSRGFLIPPCSLCGGLY